MPLSAGTQLGLKIMVVLGAASVCNLQTPSLQQYVATERLRGVGAAAGA
jgi:hypothetical protein